MSDGHLVVSSVAVDAATAIARRLRRRLAESGAQVTYVVATNYSATASEDMGEVTDLVLQSFEDVVDAALRDGSLQAAFDDASSGAALGTVDVAESLTVATSSTSQLVGSATFEGQQECPAGTYSLSGASYCVYCDPGSYTSSAGQTSCLFADAGSFVSETGATQQWTCPAGKYTAGSGMSSCASCAAGTFQSAAGETSCQLSSSGSYVSAQGATVEVPCAAGFYSGSGASACSACDVGFYASATGQSACTLADAGFFVEAAGASSQVA